MPIQSCTLPGGGKGWKWGESGHCYPTRAGALKQMRAIKYSQSHAAEKSILERVGDALKEINQEKKNE